MEDAMKITIIATGFENENEDLSVPAATAAKAAPAAAAAKPAEKPAERAQPSADDDISDDELDELLDVYKRQVFTVATVLFCAAAWFGL